MIINSRIIAYVSISASLLLSLWFLYYGNFLGGDYNNPDFEKIRSLQPFISGISIPLITFGTSLLVIETFRNSLLQNISNNFFKLIDQNRKILDGVNVDTSHLPNGDITSKGKDFFDDLCAQIAKDYFAITYNNNEILDSFDETLKKNTINKEGKNLLVAIYDHYYHIHQSDLGHYFRNLYYIVRYIDKSNLRKSDKIEFIKILRSQISNYELLLLAYNGLHPLGEKFHKYIMDYEILKSLNSETKLPESYEKRIVDIKLLMHEYNYLENYWNEENNKKNDQY